eukprot:11768702-Alexandrium_andersonii.AAC.1
MRRTHEIALAGPWIRGGAGAPPGFRARSQRRRAKRGAALDRRIHALPQLCLLYTSPSPRD